MFAKNMEADSYLIKPGKTKKSVDFQILKPAKGAQRLDELRGGYKASMGPFGPV